MMLSTTRDGGILRWTADDFRAECEENRRRVALGLPSLYDEAATPKVPIYEPLSDAKNISPESNWLEEGWPADLRFSHHSYSG